MKLRSLKFKRHTWRVIIGSALIALSLLLASSREPTLLETVQARGELRMATRMGPLTYYQDGRGENGFEYLLASKFAQSLGVNLRITTTDTIAKLYNMLGGPNADFIAATLTITPKRKTISQFSDSYADVVQMVIYKRGTRRPKTVNDLIGKRLVVIANSSHEERLQELKLTYPELTWETIANVEMVELIEMVNEGDVDFAVVDSTSYSAHRTMYPKAKEAFAITEPQQLAWAFAGHHDDTLVQAANRFLADIQANGYLEELREQFFSGVKNFTIAGSQVFISQLNNTLPKYESLFREVADEMKMDWHLLAAIAYQESHWNPAAVSPTGVKGMMMLTKAAAKEVEVKDRKDPHQSLRGGADYLARVKSRLPDDILEPDRTWMALAAYNVGLGHLEDARVLTERAGKDPHLWEDVRQHLPLLQREKYFSTVRHGYARGGEPVIYVQNIRKYMRILQWNTVESNRRYTRDKDQQPVDPPTWNPRSFVTL